MRLLLIGIDGIDWPRLNDLIENGQVPNIRRMLKSGFYARLKSDSTLSSSSVWTSVATGMSQDKHKISDDAFCFIPKLINFKKWPFKSYFKIVKISPYLTHMRNVKALWNILSENKKNVGVIGWWCTYPAEEVKGYIITPYNYLFNQISLYKPNTKFYTFPEGLYSQLQHIAVPSGELGPEELKRLGISVPVGPTWHLARDVSFANMSYYMMKNWDFPDLFMVFFEGLKSITSRYYAASENGFNSLQEEWEISLRQHYFFIDDIIGKLWHLMPNDDSAILVVATPCFLNVSTNSAEQKYGVFMLAGNGIAQNAKDRLVSVFDVTPTILALLGLPVARDFRGKVLVESFSAELHRNTRITSISSYG